MRTPTARAARTVRPTPCIRASATHAPWFGWRCPSPSLRGSLPLPACGEGVGVRGDPDSFLHFGEHVFAEPPHFGDHRVGSVAGKIEIDIADAEIAKRPQI